jgi:Uma2 family endonuclease
MSTIARFSLEEYERMATLGAFDAVFPRRLELIRGEIIEMSPVGTMHADVIDRLMQWSITAVSQKPIRVRIQNPIRVPLDESEPQPDIVWAVEKNYSKRHPEPHELLLLIEVADSSLATDRADKLILYAEAGIADYWIVNLIDKQIEVYRQPSGKSYESTTVHRGNDAVHPLARPEAALLPSRLFES